LTTSGSGNRGVDQNLSVGVDQSGAKPGFSLPSFTLQLNVRDGLLDGLLPRASVVLRRIPCSMQSIRNVAKPCPLEKANESGAPHQPQPA